MASELPGGFRVCSTDEVYGPGSGDPRLNLRVWIEVPGIGWLATSERSELKIRKVLASLDLPHAMEAKRLREAIETFFRVTGIGEFIEKHELHESGEYEPESDLLAALSAPAPDPHPVEALVEDFRLRARLIRDARPQFGRCAVPVADTWTAAGRQLAAALSGKGGDHGA